MGVVLTSRSARDMALDAPEEFAGHFGLSPAETAALTAMANDLSDLMPGFVQKRERSLRQAFRITLSLLGPENVTELVEDYSEAYAPIDSTQADFLRFGDFLVTETREFADRLQYGGIIADVARFERLRIRAYTSEGPLWPEAERDPLDPRKVDASRPLWLHRSAAVDTFGWDVRTVRSWAMLSRLRPDPSNLLCFQRGDEGEGQTLRIDDEAARAVEMIALRPGEVTAAEVVSATGSARSPEALLGKLISNGVIRGTTS